MDFKVNGKTVSYDGDAEMPLLWYLRDIAGMTGTKFGCGEGLCGACTVHVDGAAVRSCQTLMEDVEGSNITTIEGLANGDKLTELQKAWAENDVPQCGYCQAGQLMQAASLLNENPNPSDEEIVDAMEGNICRCGTYERIKKAIRQVAEA
ncbi:(2Fe-2S)-binding protein [Kordiimonas sp. SCSIO 12603]|uniref:(2Fe-2S)-binding protein n=1 Tax=Kordiimonas sp. SCSIO 12603 TaxID=2829596 RepID=UPI0021077980|nr:(2Fe-2S)-binding protein [Kordiimonas sp. SCSIO 12603]UTW60292.1 (2Fe-2S)-binding protein [Kordiimonas sp. SCSIO 12603]